MATESRSLFQLLKESVNGFSEDDCPTMAAALSYYTVFSLPPLLVLLLSILPQAPTFPQVPKPHPEPACVSLEWIVCHPERSEGGMTRLMPPSLRSG